MSASPPVRSAERSAAATTIREFVDELLGHYRDLQRHLRYQLRNPDDAADIAQASFERVYANGLNNARKNGPAIESLRGLLFRVAHNLCIDEARRRKVSQNWLALHGPLEAEAMAPSAEQVVSQRQMVERVAAVLASLPARRMQVFLLFRAYGHSRAEIAQQLGITEAAVAKHLVRATLDCSHALRNLYLDSDSAVDRPEPGRGPAADGGN
ncbi:RNA polymerase sigma factor, sigma-70 family protein 5 [Achromobacter xylosoxidans A8]|uniref:RNA polymerase sigma factor, sigma-70 family protein 5 n=1 Tax=Achromobacter xylosoxidans (strain A8) TaxID=762376 RepID=E3HEQ4_ACHXA|nr:RNA polymerase sigma factor [Achromobacter xylosoxidans]ADP16463.1 RNA polymerase sigma factor, sigma-70 family protein 5 [Achromobacter xylosoxidans A8]